MPSPSRRERALSLIMSRPVHISPQKRKKVGTHSVEMPPIPALEGKRILSLDLGRRTGWAVVTPDIEDSGVHELYDQKGLIKSFQDGLRFVAFGKWLEAMDAGHGGFDVVALEAVHPATHRSSRAHQMYAGYRAMLMSWATLTGKTLIPIPVGTIKGAITGKGNADKDAMMGALREMGYPVYDDGEADAIGIMLTLLALPFMISQVSKTDRKTVDSDRPREYLEISKPTRPKNERTKGPNLRGGKPRRGRRSEPLHQFPN